MRGSVIELHDVQKRFGDVTALDGVSLAFSEGEFFALLGPSGCGKTTLLRILAGFEQPDRGRVFLDGEDITEVRALRRPVNLMFQSYALFPHLSVERNVAYGLEMERLPKTDIAKRVDDMLTMVQLDQIRSRKPRQLSGGQQQRVALARSLIKRPRVLLLDEPLGALDKKLRGEMQLELKRLQHDLGTTFVVVTHDQEEALVMADRIALMRDGNIAQVGAPQALYEYPASRFVADFIGVSNFIEGRLDRHGVIVDGHGTLSADVAGAGQPDDEVTLAVRPERITLTAGPGLLTSTTREGAAINRLAGEIAEIAYHGQDLTVHVRVAGIERAVVVRIPAAQADASNWETGQAVCCNWQAVDGRVLA